MTHTNRRWPAIAAAIRGLDGLTLGLMVGALAINLLLPRPDPARRLAEALIGPVERVAMPGPPAFRAGSAAVLFFGVAGVQGAVRGAVVVHGDRIEQVVLFREHEGLDHTALRQPDFAGQFRGRQAAPPIVVHTVTGATASSQRVIDAVNERLKVWKALTS